MEYQKFVRSRIKWALFLTLGASVILLLLGYQPQAKGVGLGGLFSVLNFFIMSKVVIGRVTRVGWAGRTFGFAWLLGRLAIMSLPLILAAKSEIFDLVATAAGLFAVQAALFLEPVTAKLSRR